MDPETLRLARKTGISPERAMSMKRKRPADPQAQRADQMAQSLARQQGQTKGMSGDRARQEQARRAGAPQTPGTPRTNQPPPPSMMGGWSGPTAAIASRDQGSGPVDQALPQMRLGAEAARRRLQPQGNRSNDAPDTRQSSRPQQPSDRRQLQRPPKPSGQGGREQFNRSVGQGGLSDFGPTGGPARPSSDRSRLQPQQSDRQSLQRPQQPSDRNQLQRPPKPSGQTQSELLRAMAQGYGMTEDEVRQEQSRRASIFSQQQAYLNRAPDGLFANANRSDPGQFDGQPRVSPTSTPGGQVRKPTPSVAPSSTPGQQIRQPTPSVSPTSVPGQQISDRNLVDPNSVPGQQISDQTRLQNVAPASVPGQQAELAESLARRDRPVFNPNDAIINDRERLQERPFNPNDAIINDRFQEFNPNDDIIADRDRLRPESFRESSGVVSDRERLRPERFNPNDAIIADRERLNRPAEGNREAQLQQLVQSSEDAARSRVSGLNFQAPQQGALEKQIQNQLSSGLAGAGSGIDPGTLSALSDFDYNAEKARKQQIEDLQRFGVLGGGGASAGAVGDVLGEFDSGTQRGRAGVRAQGINDAFSRTLPAAQQLAGDQANRASADSQFGAEFGLRQAGLEQDIANQGLTRGLAATDATGRERLEEESRRSDLAANLADRQLGQQESQFGRGLDEQQAGREQQGEQFGASLSEQEEGRRQQGSQFGQSLNEQAQGRLQQGRQFGQQLAEQSAQFGAGLQEQQSGRLQQGAQFGRGADLAEQQRRDQVNQNRQDQQLAIGRETGRISGSLLGQVPVTDAQGNPVLNEDGSPMTQNAASQDTLAQQQLNQQGSQFNRGFGLDQMNASRQNRLAQDQLAQQGSQFDRNLDQQGSQFNRGFGLDQMNASRANRLQQDQLAQQGSQFDRNLAQQGTQFQDQRALQEAGITGRFNDERTMQGEQSLLANTLAREGGVRAEDQFRDRDPLSIALAAYELDINDPALQRRVDEVSSGQRTPDGTNGGTGGDRNTIIDPRAGAQSQMVENPFGAELGRADTSAWESTDWRNLERNYEAIHDRSDWSDFDMSTDQLQSLTEMHGQATEVRPGSALSYVDWEKKQGQRPRSREDYEEATGGTQKGYLMIFEDGTQIKVPSNRESGKDQRIESDIDTKVIYESRE